MHPESFGWPADESDVDALTGFADGIISALEEHGCCSINLPEAPEAPQRAASRLSALLEESFVSPAQPFTSAYLGSDPSGSEVASFDVETVDDPSLSNLVGQLEAVTQLLEPWMSYHLGFVPDVPCPETMLRRARSKHGGDAASEGSLVANSKNIIANREELSSSGAVGDFLEWATRRRLCLFLFIDISGTLSLKRRHAKTESADSDDIVMEPSPNTLLLWRHDAFTYTYVPRSGDLVLQTWVLEEKTDLVLDAVSGDGATIDEVKGSIVKDMPPVRFPMQVTGTAVHGASYWNVHQLWLALFSAIDNVRDAPKTRWDWEVELAGIKITDDWGIAKHCSFVDDEMVQCFDAETFGATPTEVMTWHPQQRLFCEAGYECLVDAGWTKETLKGAEISVWACDLGPDNEFIGLGEAWKPEAWRGSDRIWTASRLSHLLGLTGSAQCVDTACSASNCAMNLCHQKLCNKVETGEGSQWGIITAAQTHTIASGFIGLSMAHMLSSKGRSRTFDYTASGFARGEGGNGAFMRVRGEECPDEQLVYANIVSTACNQDGRSASLTAPNGPSQTAVIQSCMRQGGLGPDSVIKFECHGTGTALGDPIEVGSCRTVMKKRALPLIQCSGKSNHGHYEAGAGMQGFLKTMMEIAHCSSASNCHLRQLNFNMDVSGYPILHPIEGTSLDGDGTDSICGVSSFGFGGTNAHANFFGQSMRNKMAEPRPLQLEKLDYVTIQCPRCLGRKCWLCGIAVPKCAPQGKHYCASVREDGASYELCSNCYDGKYVIKAPSYAEERDPGLPLHVRGSWSRFQTLEEMCWIPSRTSGHYECSITLGSSRKEYFQLVVDKEFTNLLYPVEGDADQHVHIDGPDADGEGKFWLIDGILDGAPAGAEYNISFTWGRSRRWVEWKRATQH